jgi:hypothetical protein
MKITDSARGRELARRRWARQRAAEAVAAASAPEPIASARARQVRALADRAEVEAARLGADPHAVEAALASEVRRHLDDLARDPVPRLGGPGAG